MALPEPVEALRALLQTSNDGVDLEHFALNRNLGSAVRARAMNPKGMVELDLAGRRVGFSKEIADAQQAAVVAALQRCHRASPDAVGFSRAQLRRQLQLKLAPALLRAWIEQLRQQALIEADGAGYRLAGRRVTLDPETSRRWHTIESTLANNGLRPMTPAELVQATKLSAAQLKPLLELFVRGGYLVKLSANLLLLPEVLLGLQKLVEQMQARSGDGEFSVADFRDASGIGRNRCIEILESFDARGITRRNGQGRHLLPAAHDLFAKLQPVAL
jgi:selenocysteine-specific elongation factor